MDDGEAQMGTTRRREDAAVESQIERSARVITGSGAAWGCSWWRITGGVEGWRDSLAGGGVVRESWIRGYPDSRTIYFGRTVGL